MGVSGLNRYITKFEKTIMDRIEMRGEIENWIAAHGGKPPQILIDLKEIAHLFVQNDEIGVILGGRFNYYNSMLRMFLENLRKTRAKLVFFFPGKKNTDDLQFFIPKAEDAYVCALKVLDNIEENADLGKLKQFLDEKNRHSTDVRMVLSFNQNLKKLVRRYGDFHVNYIRHNQEIARYARENQDEVLAVISNDTDFMAFEGDFEFWRANGINYKHLTCIRYCKKKLHEKLGFDYGACQVQLLSALCGSNYLPIYILSEFLQNLKDTITDPLARGKILLVADYVKRQNCEMIKNKPKYDLDKIARDVFGDDYSMEQLNSIANGLECYNLDFDPNGSPGKNSFLKFCKLHDSFMYKLVTDDIFTIRDITYIDYRNYNSKTYTELIIPILMKMCGILFKDHPRRPTERKICIKHAHDEPSRLTEETIIYPPMRLPELFDLIFKNKERKLDVVRLPLFEWLLDLDEGFMKKLNEKPKIQGFHAAIIALQYLIQQGELNAKEANAILYTEFKVRTLGTNQNDYPEEPNIRFIRIAHIYVKIYTLVSHALDVCGLHGLTDLIRFEGALFHKHMQKFDIANEQQLAAFESSTDSIWSFSKN